MRLSKFHYSEYVGTNQEWTVEGLVLGHRNLIVGKNASGKSRIVNVITALTHHLSGLRQPGLSGSFDATFINGTDTYRYEVQCEDEQVVHESLQVNDKRLLDRTKGGGGTIWASAIDSGRDVQFQTPPNQFAAVARRDSIQHSFLEPLGEWANSARTYLFGTPLGRETLGMVVPNFSPTPNARDQNAIVALYKHAIKQFGNDFQKAVIADLAEVGYELESVDVSAPISMRVLESPGQIVGLIVKERSLKGLTDQPSMSQGMFRALALFIHVNYGYFTKTATCILIDDIGEGLDFERSCRVIDRLRSRTENTNVQLIMTTNDRFVMNRVPLEEWSILNRVGSKVSVRNYENSRAQFEEFRFTGLGNFSFFEMDLANEKSN